MRASESGSGKKIMTAQVEVGKQLSSSTKNKMDRSAGEKRLTVCVEDASLWREISLPSWWETCVASFRVQDVGVWL